MTNPDLNLLVTLDVVLAEGSVARAAKRLGLSPSAMSRALARLRETTGDPLLVRAGRGLVMTPRGQELRGRVGSVVQEAKGLLRAAEVLDVRGMKRTFTIRTREGFVETYGAALIERVRREAPGVRLCFVPKPDRESGPLREGSVDLETGVVGRGTSPELMVQGLFKDRWIGVVRAGHALSKGRVTAKRYAAGGHVVVSRRGEARGRIDEALEKLGLEREIVAVVGGFGEALALARGSDWIATVPERQTGKLHEGMFGFELPVEMKGMMISLLWHPRMDADGGHRWLRGVVREVCAGGGEGAG